VPSACDRKELAAKGRSNITLMADVDLDSIAARDFDCVFCPGGPGTKLLREDQRVIMPRPIAAVNVGCAVRVNNLRGGPPRKTTQPEGSA
jgi:hypothetical protein